MAEKGLSKQDRRIERYFEATLGAGSVIKTKAKRDGGRRSYMASKGQTPCQSAGVGACCSFRQRPIMTRHGPSSGHLRIAIWRIPEGHDAVAGELVDRSPAGGDRRHQRIEVSR